MKTPALLIASQFSTNLRAYLTPEQLAAAVAANLAETNSAVCHSHDDCDANAFMADAFSSVMGREIDLQSDADSALWDYAWTLAKNAGFSL